MIIDKLNDFINLGNESDFVEKNKIRLGCYNKHYYLCCKLNHDFKQNYFENLKINKNTYKKDTQNIDVIKIKNSDENKSKDDNKIIDKQIKEIATHLSIKTNKYNYRKKNADIFENQVCQFLNDNDSEDLQNLILFFNLKYPKIREGKIIFDSVRLSFSPFYNNLYGFREIDVCLKNKNARILDDKILDNNLCYKSDKYKFKKMKVEEIDVSLNKDSIIFCEVKNSFGNITKGNQNFSKIQIEGNEELKSDERKSCGEGTEESDENKENKDNDDNDNCTITYMD